MKLQSPLIHSHHNMIPSFIVKHIANTPFIVATLLSINTAIEDGQLPQDPYVAILKKIRDSFIPNFRLHGKDRYGPNPLKRQQLEKEYDRHKPQWELDFEAKHGRSKAIPRDPPVSGQMLCRFWEQALDRNPTGDQAKLILERIAAEADLLHVDDYEAMLLPFTVSFQSAMNSRPKNWNYSPVYRRLFLAMLSSHLERYVGTEPVSPRDWSRTPVGCSACLPCKAFTYFAIDPMRQVQSFRFREKLPAHLSEFLDESLDFSNTGSISLLVTKTTKRFKVEKAAWSVRVAEAKDHLRRLNQLVDMRRVLGSDHEKVAKQLLIRLPAHTTAPTPATMQNLVRNNREVVAQSAPKQPVQSLSPPRAAPATRDAATPTKRVALTPTSSNARRPMREVSRRISAYFSTKRRGVKRKAETQVIDLTIDD